jgi:hypothetical protein
MRTMTQGKRWGSTKKNIYLAACTETQCRRMRRAISWQCLAFTGSAPYLVKQVLGYEPHRTAISVAVTHRRPKKAKLSILG